MGTNLADWSKELQPRLIELGKDADDEVRNVMGEAACLLAAFNEQTSILVEALSRLRTECELEGLRTRAGFDCWMTAADLALKKATSK